MGRNAYEYCPKKNSQIVCKNYLNPSEINLIFLEANSNFFKFSSYIQFNLIYLHWISNAYFLEL